MPYAGGDEQDLVDALRAANALEISLVAEDVGQIVGHIAFTQAFPENGAVGWYALGPVSAAPERQREGIGRRLIETGVEILRERGAAGCILIGNPALYSKFGFVLRPDLAPASEPAEFFQMLALAAKEPGSIVHFHPLFAGESEPAEPSASDSGV
jgi:putative acetyltransferase